MDSVFQSCTSNGLGCDTTNTSAAKGIWGGTTHIMQTLGIKLSTSVQLPIKHEKS